MTTMQRGLSAVGCVAALLALALLADDARAFRRYQDGCNDPSCHGDFTGPTSPKGSTFPFDNKMRMHDDATAMNTECDLCHTTGDQRNPFIGSSDGTANNPGLGCTGCHNPRGLRRHHPPAVVDCFAGGICHPNPAPPPESTNPTYYGTVDTFADDSCNLTQQANIGENWTIGDFEGLDNDGDDLYDGNDPDCAVAQTPGAPQLLLVAAHTPGTGEITITYSPACAATDNNIEWGLISQLGTAMPYSGQACAILNTGTATWAYPAGEVFFLVVGNNAVVEGSYGLDSTGAERPEDVASMTCPVPQDLADRCD